ncbi:unnamed protein product, partial [Iphiclides podalirius]
MVKYIEQIGIIRSDVAGINEGSVASSRRTMGGHTCARGLITRVVCTGLLAAARGRSIAKFKVSKTLQ